MSWSAYLNDDRGHEEVLCGYTHNTNRMIAAALVAAGEPALPDECAGPLGKVIGPPWWDRLNGASGIDGRDYLALILKGLRSDPGRFRAMNPSNGWGDYDSLIGTLQKMHDAVPSWPTRWTVYG